MKANIFYSLAITLVAALLSPLGHAADAAYVLKPGDTVLITIFQEDDLTTEAKISPSGDIEFPLIGTVKLAGKTVKDSVAEITNRLNQGLVVDPKVMMTVTGSTVEQAAVMGQVQKAGRVEIPGDAKLDLLTAIAIAGGFTADADPRDVVVRRQAGGEGKILRIDVEKLGRDANAKTVFLEAGDVVIVGELLPRWVTVMGEVEKPGVIELPRKGRFDLLNVIAQAGGYTSIANPKRVSVRRQIDGEEKLFQIDARKLAEDPAAQPFYLEPDDVVTVAESFF